MKDQVDKLKELGIRTELINSTIDSYDIQIILNDLSNPNTDIKFLYIAPERLNSSEFIRVISGVKIALVAIDEAHCISQW
jgi:ATP-dependent DNA helicase RecQ